MKPAREQSRLRIIAGKWRSRVITFPLIADLRPTSNRIRETLFNWLRDLVPGEYCLDLFAGSGACGIEALSRGASHVVFVEKNKIAATMIGNNLAALDASTNEVFCADVMGWLALPGRTGEQKFGLVFIDPPYTADLELEACRELEASNKLKATALIYLESNKTLQIEKFPTNWRLKKSKKAGAVNYYLFEREESSGY